MTGFTIIVENNTPSDQYYILFAASPIVLKPPGQGTFANIFIAAPVTQPTGNANFGFESTPYAVCGEASANVGIGANVGVCNPCPIQIGNTATGVLGTDVHVLLVGDDAEFNTKHITHTEQTGYGIITPNFNLPDPAHKFVGYGGKTKTGIILPLASLPMLPNTTFIIEPHLVYTVGTGSFTAGDIIDVTTLGPTISIDFATHRPIAIVSQGANLEFTVVQ